MAIRGGSDVHLFFASLDQTARPGVFSPLRGEPPLQVHIIAPREIPLCSLRYGRRALFFIQLFRMPSLFSPQAEQFRAQLTAISRSKSRYLLIGTPELLKDLPEGSTQGFAGRLNPGATADDVQAAVQCVRANRLWCCYRDLECLLNRNSSSKNHSGSWRLTPRQREVASSIAKGHTNSEIAARLGISVETVKSHVSAALGELGLSNRTELAVFAADLTTRACHTTHVRR